MAAGSTGQKMETPPWAAAHRLHYTSHIGIAEFTIECHIQYVQVKAFLCFFIINSVLVCLIDFIELNPIKSDFMFSNFMFNNLM